jgi:hypothetical protein
MERSFRSLIRWTLDESLKAFRHGPSYEFSIIRDASQHEGRTPLGSGEEVELREMRLHLQISDPSAGRELSSLHKETNQRNYMDVRSFTTRLIVAFAIVVVVFIAIDHASAGPTPSAPSIRMIPVSSIVTSSTTSTTAAPVAPIATPAPSAPGCFADLAASVGWPADAIPHLTQLVERESHCDPSSNTGYRPSTGDWSLGLLQINTLGSLWPARAAQCGLSQREDLLNPSTNLACGLVLYKDSGFGPWGG